MMLFCVFAFTFACQLCVNFMSTALELNADLASLENGSGQTVTLAATSNFSISNATVFKIGKMLVGSIILQCTSNFTGGDLIRFANATLPNYYFGIAAVTAGQWSYDVTKSVRVYFKTDGSVALTSSITSGQFITIPVCIKVN